MKIQMKLHLLYIVAIVLLASCENEIPYNPDNQQPLLIMNAQLDTGKDVNEVFLHLSKGSSIVRLNEATLTLFINNRIAETPQALTPEEIFGPPENYPEDAIFVYDAILYKLFRLNTPLHPGDNIRLEATAENGKYHASAEVTVPQPIESLHVDTCLAYLREYSGQTLYRQYKITLQDRPNEKNYYRLDIWNDRSYYCKWKEYLEDENGSLIKVEDEDGSWHWASIPRDTTILAPPQNEIINREDVILTDGHPGNYDDEENELFPTINNKYNIFNDNTFRNSYATLKVYTPLSVSYTHLDVYKRQSSRRSWTPWEPRGMSITKYPTSASPACTHATTLLTGKAFRIWAAALQPTPSMRRQGNGTQLLWKDT